MGKPYTTAELGFGWISLPDANVCSSSKVCTNGETSLSVRMLNLYRNKAFGVGAGLQWAASLRSNTAQGADSLKRDHSRSYFLIESHFRYYAFKTGGWEWWGGAHAGAVIVNDTWTVKSDREPYGNISLIGSRGVSLGTEGLSLGIGLGTEWLFSKNWSFGSMFRYSSWFLPETLSETTTGDQASLAGQVNMFDLGLIFAYRISL